MKFGSKKDIIGLDVGSATTQVVRIGFSGGKASLDLMASVDTGLADDSFSQIIKEFLGGIGVKGSLTAVCFDDPSMIIRKMELPKMPEPDFTEAIRWNLRDLVEADLSEYTVTHSLIEKTEDETPILKIVAYAVKKDTIMDFKSRIEGMGLAPHFVEPEAVALAATLDRCEGNSDDFVAGVDIGRSHSLFYVVGGRTFVFSRPMPGINMELFDKSPDEFPQKLAIEIQKSIDTFQVNFDMQPVQKVFLSGGGALVPDIDEYLKTNMGIEAYILNPLKNIENTEAFADQKPELFAKAISLAFIQS